VQVNPNVLDVGHHVIAVLLITADTHSPIVTVLAP
jgi:hypothetical protein